MDSSRDPLLESLVKIAEIQPATDPHEVFHVTLLIRGVLVTGRIIRHDEFIRHHAFVEKLWNTSPRPESGKAPHQRIAGEGDRWCLHLADARFSLPGQAPASTTTQGVYWRGRLSEVSGFSIVKKANPGT